MNNNRNAYERRLFVSTLVLISFLCVLCGNSSAQVFKTIHPGVEHARVDHKIGTDPVKINLLRLDLTKVRIDVHHALDKAIGLETTSSIATRHSAVAAINAGFFRLDKSQFAGDSAGVLMIDGELVSEGRLNRIALELENSRNETAVFIHRRNAATWIGVEKKGFPNRVSGINRERKEKEIILYGPAFGLTTATDQNGTEIILSGCSRVYRAKYLAASCRKVEVKELTGNSPIPRDGYVLSISAGDFETKSLVLKDLRYFQSPSNKNTRLYLRSEIGYQEIVGLPTKSTDIVAGVPQLIRNGKIDITWQQEKAGKSFVEMRHPRTAVAKLPDRRFLMITVDGRQPGVSVGMTLQELADYLLSLGAIDAMNLDGGGSTTMFVNGKVINTPSDKEGERKVGDAILVTLRKNARGRGR